MFVSVGGSGSTWKLGDMKMVINGKDGGAYRVNKIQFLDPATSKVDQDKIYTYYGVEDDAVTGDDDGWYTVNGDKSKDDEYSNDVAFPAGTAFLCNFDTRYNASLTFAGQVLAGNVTIDTVVDSNAMPYMYIVNPIAANLTLADIKMVIDGKDGGAYRENKIQFIDPATSKVDQDKIYTYFGVEDEATAGDDDGWYAYNPNDEEKDDVYSNDVVLPCGAGFLCNFDTRYAAKLVFTNPVK